MQRHNLRSQNESNREELIKYIVQGIQEVKGHDIVDMDLREIKNSICDNFIICHGTSKRQVDAIAESVEKSVKENASINPWHKEGTQNAEWILLDYIDVVVHIFNEQNRKFYNLEGLWADAKITQIDQINKE
ncbi:MAG: ribosome silencing factor [Sphingobacteriia bacterium]|nr:ribosome silencing factor [Sphingobacteriia bacterium]